MGWSGGALAADLQHVEDLGPIGRQGDELEHFDLRHVGRLDAIGGQRDLALFPADRHFFGHRRHDAGVVGIDDRLAAGEQEQSQAKREQASRNV